VVLPRLNVAFFEGARRVLLENAPNRTVAGIHIPKDVFAQMLGHSLVGLIESPS
jgi:hypothetical protein